jgi:hypothetical protein
MKVQTAMLTALCACACLGIAGSQTAAAPAPLPIGVPLMSCSNSKLTANVPGARIVQGIPVFSRRLATVFDASMDDFGTSAGGDALELFCVSHLQTDALGTVAACLSKESCPWR